jgi:ABC-2 type transport system ATP-binding protein
VGVIRAGRLLAEGAPEQLRRHGARTVTVDGRGFAPALGTLRARPEVVSAEANNGRLEIQLRTDAATAPLIRLLVEAGAEVEEVRRGAGSLEAAFLALLEEPEAAP